jgi:hypothetical protein
MISAPPLAVSVIGSPADEDHVRCARWPIGITEHGYSAIDIAFSAHHAQQVAAFNLRGQGDGNFGRGTHNLA